MLLKMLESREKSEKVYWSKKVFLQTYNELMEKDFFGIKGRETFNHFH